MVKRAKKLNKYTKSKSTITLNDKISVTAKTFAKIQREDTEPEGKIPPKLWLVIIVQLTLTIHMAKSQPTSSKNKILKKLELRVDPGFIFKNEKS